MVSWGPNQQTSSRNYHGQISGKVMAIVLLIFSMRAMWMIMIDTHWYDTIDYWTIVQYHHGNLTNKNRNCTNHHRTFNIWTNTVDEIPHFNWLASWQPPWPPRERRLGLSHWWSLEADAWLGHMAGWELPELIRGFYSWENHWWMGDVPTASQPEGFWLQPLVILDIL